MNHSYNYEIACEYGVNSATFLQNLAFWIKKNQENNRNNKDNYTWSFQTQAELSKILPFSIDQIKRMVKKLKDAGIIKVEQYNKSSYNRTNWYTIIDTKISQLLNITKKIFKGKFEIKLDDTMIKQAQNLNINDIDNEFEKFVSFNKNKFKSLKLMHSKWLLWLKQAVKYHKQQNKKTAQSQNQEKAAYKWDFKKAQFDSNKIKDWLDFTAKINWIDDYYLKDINPFVINANNGKLTIFWKDVLHPDFNKQEILLYIKNDDVSDDSVIDVELLS